MLLGYLIMRALGDLVRVVDRLPDRAGRSWARIPNAATGPFDTENYLGSCAGEAALSRRARGALFDRVIAALHRRRDTKNDADLAPGMPCLTRWDPLFQDYMTLADLCRFPTRQFAFHCVQLTHDERPRPDG